MKAEDLEQSGAILTSLARNEFPEIVDGALVDRYKQSLPESFLEASLKRHREFLEQTQAKLEAPSRTEEVAENAQFIRSLARKSKSKVRRRASASTASEAETQDQPNLEAEPTAPKAPPSEDEPTGEFDDFLDDLETAEELPSSSSVEVEESDLVAEAEAEPKLEGGAEHSPMTSLPPDLEEQVLGDLGEAEEEAIEPEGVSSPPIDIGVEGKKAEPAQPDRLPPNLEELLDTGEELPEPTSESSVEVQKKWEPSFDIAPLESELVRYWGQESFQPKRREPSSQEDLKSTAPKGLQELVVDLEPTGEPTPIITVPDDEALGLDSSRDTEDARAQKALIMLKGFSTLNQNIITKAVAEGQLAPDELDALEHMLLSQEPEDEVVRYVYNLLRLRRAPDLVAPQVQEQTYYKPTPIEFLKHNVFSYSFVVALGLFIAIGMVLLYRAASLVVRSEDAYDRGIELLREGSFLDAERRYTQAMELRPNIKRINEFAGYYVQRRRFVDAATKYEDALRLRSNDFATLFNLANMHVVKSDFEEAERRLIGLQAAHPKRLSVRESMGNLYIEWGSTESSKLSKAELLYNNLMQSEGLKAKYFLRKMQIEILRDNFPHAKFYYQHASVQDSNFISLKLHGAWVEYLQSKYQAMLEKGPGSRYDSEQLFVVRTVTSLIQKIYEAHGDEVWNHYLSARWALVTKEWEKALLFARKGLLAYAQLHGYSDFEVANFHNIIGEVSEHNNDLLAALSAYESSLKLNPYQSIPHYRLGRMQLLVLGNLDKAKEHFNAAKLYWNGGHSEIYKNLLYSLGYVHYHSRQVDAARESEVALNYWNELATIEPTHVLPSYVLGLAYLSLGEYKLAEAEFTLTLDRFKTFLNIYEEYKSAVRLDLQNKVRLLTELYNNLALAQLGSALENHRPIQNRKNALGNLMHSITLKGKMGLVKGVPLINYHLAQAGGRDMERFKVADVFLPKVFWD